MNNMKRKNGFSLVEVVISLAVIIIVSATALTIVLHSIADKATAVHRTQAQNFSYNVWECFKAADSADEFETLVAFAEEEDLTEENGMYVYTSEEHKFTAQIQAVFSENGKGAFQITVNDKNEKEIVAFSYTKGGGI